MSITETNRSQARIRSTRANRQKSPLLYVDLELNGTRVFSFEASATLTVARSKVGERQPELVGTTLRLPSRLVSRLRHCTIEPVEGGKVLVTDRGSTNGTSVNGRSVDHRITIPTPCTVEVAPYDLIVSREREDYETVALRHRALVGDADLQLDAQSGAIRLRDGTSVAGLSPLQHAIVAHLIERYPRPVASSELLEAVNRSGSRQSLYTQISEIRDRLESIVSGGGDLIHSRRGFGYSLTPLPDA